MLSNESYISFVSFRQASEPSMNFNISKTVYSKSFQSGRIQPKSIVKNLLLIAYAGMQIWIHTGCGNECFSFQIIDSFSGGTLDLAWLWVSYKFDYEMAFVCYQNIRELKQWHFWATYVNRKWGHFPSASKRKKSTSGWRASLWAPYVRIFLVGRQKMRQAISSL